MYTRDKDNPTAWTEQEVKEQLQYLVYTRDKDNPTARTEQEVKEQEMRELRCQEIIPRDPRV